MNIAIRKLPPWLILLILVLTSNEVIDASEIVATHLNMPINIQSIIRGSP